jgi:hypothetical protein
VSWLDPFVVSGIAGNPVSVANNAAARVVTPLLDGMVVFVKSPLRSWTYSATTGAGFADDDRTILKPTAISLGVNGRFYPSDPAAVVPTFAALRLAVSGQQQMLHVQARATLGDGGGGNFDYDASDTTSADNDATLLVAGSRRYKRRWSGAVHGHWWGMKPNDSAFNNRAAFTACMVFAAYTYEIVLDGAVYSLWDPGPVLDGQLGFTAALQPPSGTVVRGVPERTVFQFRAAVTGGDPDVVAQVALRSVDATPMLRTTAYTVGQLRYVNGMLYQVNSITTGITSGSVPAGLNGSVFSGTVTDGGVFWQFAGTRYRGYGLVFGEGVVDCRFYGVTLDGMCVWQDGQTIPTGIPAYGKTHEFKSPDQTIGVGSDYNGATFAFGFDLYHKPISIGGTLGGVFGHNVDHIVFERCTIKRWRGECVIGDGYSLTSPHTTLKFERCHFEETPGLSTPVGLEVRGCTFRHVLNLLDRAHGVADFRWEGNLAEDCGTGLNAELGLLNGDTPGAVVIARNVFRNIYHSGIFWSSSPSANPAFATVNGMRVEYNDFFDCAWDVGTTDRAAIRLADATTIGSFNVSIIGNKIHVGSLTAPARTGGLTATNLYAGVALFGKYTGLDIRHNETIYDLAATAAGNAISFALSLVLTADSSRVNHRGNKWKSRLGPSTAGNLHFGSWGDNDYTATVFDQDAAEITTTTINPRREAWGATNALDNTLSAISAIANPARWTEGQRITLGGAGNVTQVLAIARSSATHQLPGIRLLRSTTHLVIEVFRRPVDGVLVWREVSYIDPATGKEPTANVVAPSFQTIESEAPLLQVWDCAAVTLAPVGATTFNDARNFPPGVAVHVTCTANATIGHNAGGATIKLFLTGAVNFVGPGEIFLMLNAAGTQVREVGRMA